MALLIKRRARVQLTMTEFGALLMEYRPRVKRNMTECRAHVIENLGRLEFRALRI